MRPLMVAFVGGDAGSWVVRRLNTVVGAPLEAVSRVEMFEESAASRLDDRDTWTLRGVTSNERYVSRAERDALAAKQEPLGRKTSTQAALIPIKKSEGWWTRWSAVRR